MAICFCTWGRVEDAGIDRFSRVNMSHSRRVGPTFTGIMVILIDNIVMQDARVALLDGAATIR